MGKARLLGAYRWLAVTLFAVLAILSAPVLSALPRVGSLL
jgi:hypothetical protein